MFFFVVRRLVYIVMTVTNLMTLCFRGKDYFGGELL